MATGPGGGRTQAQPIPQASHRGAPAPSPGSAVSPPSKRELASWWKKFRKNTEKDEEKVNQIPGIFGVPLAESIRYANVAISLNNDQGESFIYGYVPIVVAKCGVFLKEKATDVEGIFRLSGSAKRIKDLQTIFNSPDRYGKGLDWTGYTVHDAANILRRYLNQLPEPIVPLEQYERFRDPLRALQQHLENHSDSHLSEISATEHDTAVAAYQRLIKQLPALNRQLLLYILDLLAVFSSKSDMNRMTAANLAAIFQPGIISHPIHDMAPQEYRLSQDVLIFLIENQDNFLIGMTDTAIDAKTQKDVESGAPSIKSPITNIGRSASNASAGADSLRKFGLRRNVSVSSHASRERTSPNVSSPGTPSTSSYGAGTGSIGVARSNTVPSKRSPAVGQHRFQRAAEPSTPTASAAPDTVAEAESMTVTPEKDQPTGSQQATASLSAGEAAAVTVVPASERQHSPKTAQEPPAAPFPDVPAPPLQADTQQSTQHTQQSLQVPRSQQTANPQTRERKISNLFAKSPIFGPSDPQQNTSQRQPRKLQKRSRLPGSMMESAQSSAASLQTDDPFHTPLVSPDLSHSQTDPMVAAGRSPAYPASVQAPSAEQPTDLDLRTPPPIHDMQSSARGSVQQKSPATSLRSGTSVTDPSDFDALDDPVTRAEKKKKSKWRFSSAATKKNDESPLAPPPLIGQIPGARASNSSIGSSSRPRPSFTAESYTAQSLVNESSNLGQISTSGQSGNESLETPKESTTEAEKKGIFGKWKAKMVQSREERREREAERERAKSPPRITGDHALSRNSLSAFAHEHLAARGRSFDKSREEIRPVVDERSRADKQPTSPQMANSLPVTQSGAPVSKQLAIVVPSTATAPSIIPLNTPANTPANPPTNTSVTEPLARAEADLGTTTTTPTQASANATKFPDATALPTETVAIPIEVVPGTPGPAVVNNPEPVIEAKQFEKPVQDAPPASAETTQSPIAQEAGGPMVQSVHRAATEH